MFGVVRIGNQQIINDSQNRLFWQGIRPVYNQHMGVLHSIAQPIFYQVPQGQVWGTNSGRLFTDADSASTRSVIDWSSMIESSRRTKQQEEEGRKWIKEICDVGAKETEQTDLFASMLLDAFGARMADNPFEAYKKAASSLQKFHRICVNQALI